MHSQYLFTITTIITTIIQNIPRNVLVKINYYTSKECKSNLKTLRHSKLNKMTCHTFFITHPKYSKTFTILYKRPYLLRRPKTSSKSQECYLCLLDCVESWWSELTVLLITGSSDPELSFSSSLTPSCIE